MAAALAAAGSSAGKTNSSTGFPLAIFAG